MLSGALVGCSAGFLNVPRIKGSHLAMKSAMLAADAYFEVLEKEGGEEEMNAGAVELYSYERALRGSWIEKELHEGKPMHYIFFSHLSSSFLCVLVCNF